MSILRCCAAIIEAGFYLQCPPSVYENPFRYHHKLYIKANPNFCDSPPPRF